MASNPRKDAFKSHILKVLRETGRGGVVAKADLVAQVRSLAPELFNEAEPCYPKCKSHRSKWQHEFDRSIYDLSQTSPPKLTSEPGRKGHYRLS